MNDLNQTLYTHAFEHIYIERTLFEHPRVKRILSHFPDAKLIEIEHYKDIFSRARQNFNLQKEHPSLILAKKEGNLIYPGAKVCQSFGNEHFYYTSSIMNCMYQCEYCYLQGMYPSGNIVVFVNLEDIWEELKKLLMKTPVYLCISYDTDLLAFEPVIEYVREWIAFAREHKNLTVEIRTKSAAFSSIQDIAVCDNVILAWTLSPADISKMYEHHTPSYEMRLHSLITAKQCGWKVRLCFDPMIYTEGWKNLYSDMIADVFSNIRPNDVLDVSFGIFRVSKTYFKKMRKQNPDSSLLYFPFELNHGVYEYPEEIAAEMIHFLKQKLLDYIPENQLFEWQSDQEEQSE